MSSETPSRVGITLETYILEGMMGHPAATGAFSLGETPKPPPQALSLGETPKPPPQALSLGETPKPPPQALSLGETPKPPPQALSLGETPKPPLAAFTSLLNQIGLAAKLITSKVRRAGLANILGYTGQTNIQGEEVQKLDEVANETLIQSLGRRGHCAAIASEEMDEILVLQKDPRARYVMVFDPLDGSSNIDVNISIGTIFGILRRPDHSTVVSEGDFLVPGNELLAAGYILYGSSTMVVLTTGVKSGVHGFTYDPTVGEFFLSHENIRIPEKGKTYSINEGNHALWAPPVRRFCEWIKEEDKATSRPYGARYVGSLVADAHRTLLKGGIFVYPADRKNPDGKLRLLYEANPFAFVFEAAGGKATTGTSRILDIVPSKLHQRVPVALGSPWDVDAFEQFMRGER